jgi:uncharacterized protein HemX
MNSDPLAKLRDIHLPPPISWWPPAAGWWLLLLIMVLLIVAVICWKRRCEALKNRPVIHSREETIDAAMVELSQLEEAIQAGEDTIMIMAGLSRLLRRTAVQLSADQSDVAGMTGEAWLQWLDAQWHEDEFCKGAGRQLTQAPYRPESDIEIKTVAGVCRGWLEAQR